MNWEMVFISGFAGAIAGGFVNLISLFLSHHWEEKKEKLAEKKKIYSKIISFGAHAHHGKNYEEIDTHVSTALLYCEEELRIALCEYMILVSEDEENVDIGKLADSHGKVTDLMGKELGF